MTHSRKCEERGVREAEAELKKKSDKGEGKKATGQIGRGESRETRRSWEKRNGSGSVMDKDWWVL